MPIKRDLTGMVFGDLSVIGPAPSRRDPNGRARTFWQCKCSCGQDVVAQTTALTAGNTTHCRWCGYKQMGAKASKHHGAHTRLYNLYKEMKRRCFNQRCKVYPLYGGRGITMCDEWIGEHGFEHFREWATHNGYDDTAKRGQCTIDRIDNNGNYSPDNCRWTNQSVQVRNSRKCHKYEYKEDFMPLPELAEKYGIPYKNLKSRIDHGWDIHRAMTTPVIHKTRRD